MKHTIRDVTVNNHVLIMYVLICVCVHTHTYTLSPKSERYFISLYNLENATA